MKSKIGATFGRGVHLSSPQNTNRQRDFIKSKPPPTAKWFQKYLFGILARSLHVHFKSIIEIKQIF